MWFPSQTGTRSDPGTRCVAAVFAMIAWGDAVAGAAQVDVSLLPAPATNVIDFTRDIRPILERSCFRCHGSERAKSEFRLDTRAMALQGGESGVDIVLSNSAASPLVHRVARLKDLDEDQWMPPPDTTPPLSREEVALVRAWIDQGLPWDSNVPSAPTLDVTPTVGWTTVDGNERVFREHRWRPEGWNGGLERFELRQQVDERTKVTTEGRALRDDYRVTLQIERRNLGFANLGFEQHRKYYSDTGSYLPGFPPGTFSLDRDLHLDLGRAWVELGLTLPAWPRMKLGYEHQYRDGQKSLTSWSPISDGSATWYALPTFKTVDEDVHILKFNLDHEIASLRFEDDFRAEFGSLKTARASEVAYPPGSEVSWLDTVREGQSHFLAANAVRLEKSFASWFFGSGGYLYSHYDAEASFSLDETSLNGSPGYARRWRSPDIVLERDTHVANLNGQFGPWAGLTGSVGVQAEWNRQKGFAEASFDTELPEGGYFLQPTSQNSDIDRTTLAEHVGLRYAAIPYTVLFAEGRLEQENLGQFEEQPGGDAALRRDTQASSDRQDFRVGFNTSPWRRLSFNAHYRWTERSTSFDHLVDVLPTPFGTFPGEGYSASIRERETETEEAEARLSYYWAAWLKTTVSYRVVSSDYFTATDPVTGYDPVTFEPVSGYLSPGTEHLAGNYDAHVVSFNASLRPLRRLSLAATFSFQDARTASGLANAAPAPPYQGQIYTLVSSGTFAWNDRTDLLAGYTFSSADFSQSNEPMGLPLGIEYQQHGFSVGLRRRLSNHAAFTLRYGFFFYDEPTSGGQNDYTAHLVFATVSFRWP